MITKSHYNLMLAMGAFLLLALALFLPLDALAQTNFGSSVDLNKQTSVLSKQANGIPQLIAVGSYVIGTFFAVRALFSLKGFIEAPDDNPLTKVLGFSAIGALLIMLPYIIGVVGKTMDLKDQKVSSASQSFEDKGF